MFPVVGKHGKRRSCQWKEPRANERRDRVITPFVRRDDAEYDRAYYSGIVAERRAKMKLRQHTPGCRFQAYDLLREAMSWFEKAEPLCPPAHDDAILRWNTCARIIERNKLVPREPKEPTEFPLE